MIKTTYLPKICIRYSAVCPYSVTTNRRWLVHSYIVRYFSTKRRSVGTGLLDQFHFMSYFVMWALTPSHVAELDDFMDRNVAMEKPYKCIRADIVALHCLVKWSKMLLIGIRLWYTSLTPFKLVLRVYILSWRAHVHTFYFWEWEYFKF
jgi:hypothetical protein